MNVCSMCGAQLEKVDEALICKSCGFGFKKGTNGKIPDMDTILANNMRELKMLRLLFPKASADQLVNLHQFHEHRVKKHPTTKDGYCEFCERDWSKLSDSEFFEQLGYQKSKWFNEDGSPKESKN